MLAHGYICSEKFCFIINYIHLKYYIIAGEASGDLHGSNLIKEIQKLDSSATFRCWGGDKMEAQGVHLVEHFKNMAFMGFIEVIRNITTILKLMSKCKSDIKSHPPDVLVLIDYPGFNMRIAEWAKKQGIKVVYYITPQVWAWHKSRVHKLGKFTDKLLVILPFEKDFFKSHHYESVFVGHPLLDAIQNFQATEPLKKTKKPLLALLPGSRKQEISHILPIMLQACKKCDMDIVLGCAPSLDESIYLKLIAKENLQNKITIYKNQTYDILSVADYAWVGSGTATLETALFGVPQIVCYKGNFLSYHIAKLLVNIPFISLVNLIADKEIVKELIQNDLTPENLTQETQHLIQNHAQIKSMYLDLKNKLGNEGASKRAATEIVKLVNI